VKAIFVQIVCGIIKTTSSLIFAQKWRLLAEQYQFQQRCPLIMNNRVFDFGDIFVKKVTEICKNITNG